MGSIRRVQCIWRPAILAHQSRNSISGFKMCYSISNLAINLFVTLVMLNFYGMTAVPSLNGTLIWRTELLLSGHSCKKVESCGLWLPEGVAWVGLWDRIDGTYWHDLANSRENGQSAYSVMSSFRVRSSTFHLVVHTVSCHLRRPHCCRSILSSQRWFCIHEPRLLWSEFCLIKMKARMSLSGPQHRDLPNPNMCERVDNCRREKGSSVVIILSADQGYYNFSSFYVTANNLDNLFYRKL